MLLAVVAVCAGVMLLAHASDRFVLGAASLARTLRVPAVVVGVVVIGFGTSAPELLVSTIGAVQGRVDASVGNVLGSNLVNVTLLLGIGAVLLPLSVSSRVIRREVPLAVGATAAYALAVQRPSRVWGALLVVAMAVAVAVLLRSAVRGRVEDPVARDVDDLVGSVRRPGRGDLGRLILGLAGTIAGAQTLLWGALAIADRTGLAEGFVGATMVAVGTSLPELVTVVQSARRGQADLMLGNLLGSNLFNAAFVGGLSMMISAAPVAASLRVVVAPAAVASGLVVWWLAATGHRLGRGEGLVLVTLYALILPLILVT